MSQSNQTQILLSSSHPHGFSYMLFRGQGGEHSYVENKNPNCLDLQHHIHNES